MNTMLTETSVDFAHAYLCRVLAHAVAAANQDGNAGTIVISDHGSQLTFEPTPEGILAATQYSSEVDGLLAYRVHRASFVILYDGPYTPENAAEIVNDGNMRSNDFTQQADIDWLQEYGC